MISQTRNIQRVFTRGLLLAILEKDTILSGIKVFDDGYIKMIVQEWDEYWEPVRCLDQTNLNEELAMLRSAWNRYIKSRFAVSYRINYCYLYFVLLESIWQYRNQIINHIWARALRTALGFECFRIIPAASDNVLAAGTCTLRNPCYLLSKLKMPKSLDDPQYLPVIIVPDTERPELFYHYRQYVLSSDSPLSLLQYPAVLKGKRSESFKLVNILAGGLKDGVDPRTDERAERLFDRLVRPILAANIRTSEKLELELIDIGAGSGSLGAALCSKIRKHYANTLVRLRFVDLELVDTTRFFQRDERKSLDGLEYWGDDYRSWVGNFRSPAASGTLRIALVFKLLNNMSHFTVRPISSEELRPYFTDGGYDSGPSVFSPSYCLAPHGPGVGSLSISNKRVLLQEGRTFPHISLSPFYRGIYSLTKPDDDCVADSMTTFLPVRYFDGDSLVTQDGKSLIGRLSETCDYTIIEDADLRPQYLVDHLDNHSIDCCSVTNMTRTLKMKGNYLYVISAKRVAVPSLGGELIW